MKAITYILANSAAIIAADRLIPGFVFQGDWLDLAVAGAILGLINSFLKPIIKLVSLPIILLTLGLFTVLINIALLLLAARLVDGMAIQSFWAAFWGVIVISLVNHIILSILKEREK